MKARQRLIPRCPLTSYPAASSSIVTPDARCPLAGLLFLNAPVFAGLVVVANVAAFAFPLSQACPAVSWLSTMIIR